MQQQPSVKPLSHWHRSVIFFSLLFAFLASLPFLYFYATGYRFDTSNPNTIVRTGGIYIGVELTGADIYADGDLVRETTRTFRRAFYLQNLTAGTHRLHVQKDEYHTWVKELPVVAHRVTEAQAFNLPLVPQVRVISEWQSATGSAVIRNPLVTASTTNEVIATTTRKNTTFTQNTEYTSLLNLWKPATSTATTTRVATITNLFDPTTASATPATTTKARGEVRLIEADEDVYAHWVGSNEQMPYYYCAEDFPRYSTSSSTTTPESVEVLPIPNSADNDSDGAPVLMHPVQTVDPTIPCDPRIRLDRKWQTVRTFDFAPRSTDHVLLALSDGIYMVEIDDRSWQNVQPVLLGAELDFKVVNDVIYVYDGTLIYQVVLEYS